jgi:hypothetical protein
MNEIKIASVKEPNKGIASVKERKKIASVKERNKGIASMKERNKNCNCERTE